MEHNPLRHGIRSDEDAKLVLRYFFWIICAIPIVKMILWILMIFAAQQLILRPTGVIALATVWAYMWFKQTKKTLAIWLCVGLSSVYWVGRFVEDILAGSGTMRACANLIPLLLLPLIIRASHRVQEAVKFLKT